MEAFTKIILRDAHGLWGGPNVYLRSDGVLIVQDVGRGPRGLVERRYRSRIDPKKIQQLDRLLAEHRFVTLTSSTGPPIPDEGRPSLWAAFADGRMHEVSKWDHDSNPDFEAIASWLVALIAGAKKAKPIFEGPYDSAWMPDELRS